ncbi:NIPSNAP family protein [Thalassovita mangrovi]|uniref:NIPSNAP domain-containing protein n=1 Tax=Thalassovita mangrovi TaxID=2692236 RepID=A0A6L8LK30_9RHOB|nr:NIPSNAP family protein [Thalassovita mangrovi]MYM56408.1 hypothetical protein [Thalassovita mangrovi]
MLYELRVYDLVPGKGPDYLDLFRRNGVQYVTRHLPMAGYWLTDSGALNRLYHLWIYESLEERLDCRAGLAADRDWNEVFVPAGFPLIVAQENMIMALREGSDLLDQVVAARKTVHPGQAADTPMFAAQYMSLTFGTARAAGAELAGRWQVVSGAAPGQTVSLYRHERDDAMATAAGAERHELLRPLSCSPLR